MAKPIDQEITAIEKTVFCSQFSRVGGIPHNAGPPQREAPELVKRQNESGDSLDTRLYCDFY